MSKSLPIASFQVAVNTTVVANRNVYTRHTFHAAQEWAIAKAKESNGKAWMDFNGLWVYDGDRDVWTLDSQ